MASEQVRLAGGKRLEVNTYEMARQSRKAETKDSENEVELKMSIHDALLIAHAQYVFFPFDTTGYTNRRFSFLRISDPPPL